MKIFDQEVTKPLNYHNLVVSKIEEYLNSKWFTSHHIAVINWAKSQLEKLARGDKCQYGEWEVPATTGNDTRITNMRLFLLGIAIYCETFTHSQNLIRVLYQAADISFDDQKKVPHCYELTSEQTYLVSMSGDSMRFLKDANFICENRRMTRAVMREATQHVGNYKVDMWFNSADQLSTKQAEQVEEKIQQHYSQKLYNLRQQADIPDSSKRPISTSSLPINIGNHSSASNDDVDMSMTYIPPSNMK